MHLSLLTQSSFKQVQLPPCRTMPCDYLGLVITCSFAPSDEIHTFFVRIGSIFAFRSPLKMFQRGRCRAKHREISVCMCHLTTNSSCWLCGDERFWGMLGNSCWAVHICNNMSYSSKLNGLQKIRLKPSKVFRNQIFSWISYTLFSKLTWKVWTSVLVLKKPQGIKSLPSGKSIFKKTTNSCDLYSRNSSSFRYHISFSFFCKGLRSTSVVSKYLVHTADPLKTGPILSSRTSQVFWNTF